MSKITDYTELTAPIGTDMLVVVDDPDGSPVTKKMTIDTLLKTRGISTPDLTGNSYTIAAEDFTVLIDDDDADVSGTVVVTLPAAADSADRILNIKKIGSSQTVQLDGNGAETIDGAATQDLAAQWDCMTIQCDGTAWFIIGRE